MVDAIQKPGILNGEFLQTIHLFPVLILGSFYDAQTSPVVSATGRTFC
jgi:hypothetical protein